MAKYVNPTKVITGICTFSYLNCWEPKAIEGGKSRAEDDFDTGDEEDFLD